MPDIILIQVMPAERDNMPRRRNGEFADEGSL